MKKSLSVAILVVLLCAVVLAVSAPFGPTVVAEPSYTAQTSDIASTNLFTPSEDGDYVVSFYASRSTTNCGGAVHISWTDEFRNIADGASSSIGSNGASTRTVYIRASSGNPIQFYTDGVSGCGGADTYDLFFTVVKE